MSSSALTLPETLFDRISAARTIAVLTGAGISAESGLSTFRGSDGIWSRFRPEELANMSAFLRNPERVWEWYQYRRNVLCNAEPNPGHKALAEWEKRVDSFTLITQNVDGLHQRAGSANVIELHGNLQTNRCLECLQETQDDVKFSGKVPVCSCGGMLRPAVVWFGEFLPEDALNAAISAAETSDLFLIIGTSAVVYPAASIPLVALDRGIPVLEINPETTPLSNQVTFSLRGSAGKILPDLLHQISLRDNPIIFK